MQDRSGLMQFLSAAPFFTPFSVLYCGCIPIRKSLAPGLSMGCNPFKGCTCSTMDHLGVCLLHLGAPPSPLASDCQSSVFFAPLASSALFQICFHRGATRMTGGA